MHLLFYVELDPTGIRQKIQKTSKLSNVLRGQICNFLMHNIVVLFSACNIEKLEIDLGMR